MSTNAKFGAAVQTCTHSIRADDMLQIRFETEKGSLYMEIKAPDGTVLYTGNGKENQTS